MFDGSKCIIICLLFEKFVIDVFCCMRRFVSVVADSAGVDLEVIMENLLKKDGVLCVVGRLFD